jgi:isochorismate hydrolase
VPIPPIPSYPMPAVGSLPPGTVEWRASPRRAVLLIHDMQEYFLAPFQPDASPRRELLANLVRLRSAAAAAEVPVVYTAQPGGMTAGQRGLLRDFWGPGMNRDERDRRILAPLAPGPGDVVFTKWRYSAFHGTPLAAHLSSLGRDQLIVTGVYANTGCLVTAVDAFSRDIETFLIPDGVADFTEAEHHQALRYAAARCAAIPRTDAVLNDLGSRNSSRAVHYLGQR